MSLTPTTAVPTPGTAPATVLVAPPTATTQRAGAGPAAAPHAPAAVLIAPSGAPAGGRASRPATPGAAITAPTTAPTAAAGSAGGLVGDLPATDIRAAGEVELIPLLRTQIDALDAGIARLIAERARLSGRIQSARIAAGGVRIELGRERRILEAYRDALGDEGTNLGTAVLRLCRGPLGSR